MTKTNYEGQSESDHSPEAYAARAAQVYGQVQVAPSVTARTSDADRWRALETAEHLAATLQAFSDYMVGQYDMPSSSRHE